MTTPSPLQSAPVLAHVVRSGFVESVHHGVVAGTAPDGSVELARGPVDVPIFPRSSNKPMQAVGMLRSGLDLDGELLALAAASHSGEPFHLEGAQRILAGAGLTEADLQNTPDRPIDEAERERWIAEGRGPTSLAQNCSGKHSAMLATCVAAGWDTATYRDPEHPLQQAIGEALADLAGEEVAATGVDGCGAPVMAISTAGLARAFGRLAAADASTPEGRVAAAIRDNPQWLGGTHRDVTALIRGVPGLIAKDGAEAVYAVGLPDGRGLAVKITDGNQRARTVVTAAALRQLGLTAYEVLAELEASPVLGHGDPVGAVVATGI
ncbi:asparaginase [Ornithinicoccus hortensis]|uniref:Asparaginase n=1 Tax=Ornithinicoccus hortensis TaxID=82346 RepID=A0A542YP50_9MICO|nr:asparaginase [Ornithinicoccus hortensis]TQL49827.1 asparaginase [Ornithinicoccus hortensis]